MNIRHKNNAAKADRAEDDNTMGNASDLDGGINWGNDDNAAEVEAVGATDQVAVLRKNVIGSFYVAAIRACGDRPKRL